MSHAGPDAVRASAYEIVDATDDSMNTDLGEIDGGPRWEGVLTIENEMTGDGRMFEGEAVRWETLPVPLRWVKSDVGEHDGAVVVGRIDEVYRDGNRVMGRGVFDGGSADGIEAARQVAAGLTPGVSVDLDDVSVEIRVKNSILTGRNIDLVAIEEDEEGVTTVAEFMPDDEVAVTTDARLRAATIVATPAFAEARIYILEDEGEPSELTVVPVIRSVTASAGRRPPRAWFADPKLSKATPLHVTDDGHVYGHLATWGTCHTGFPNECVQPPSSATNYAYYRTGVVVTDDGGEVPVGHVTMNTSHANRRFGAADTSAHYEHTGACVADVAAGEDAFGIWVSGSMRPDVDDDEIAVLRSSPLSGDWRRIGGNLELVAALAVNSPGFPIPRALVAGGGVKSLQSSNVVMPAPTPEPQMDAALRRVVERERKQMQSELEAADKARTRVLVASAHAKMATARHR